MHCWPTHLEDERAPTLFGRASCEDEIIDSTGAGVVLAEIDSKGWSGVMAAKEEKVATMKEEIVSKHRKVQKQTKLITPYADQVKEVNREHWTT